MNTQEMLNFARICLRLSRHGMFPEDVFKLIQCSRQMNRWGTAHCNGDVQTDEDTGKIYRYWGVGDKPPQLVSIPDRGKAILARASKIARAHHLYVYHQSDPRGCSLYLLRRKDMKNKDNIQYTNGVALYV